MYWTGYIADDYGLSWIEISEAEDDGYVAIWMRNDLLDDVESKEDLEGYGKRFYRHLEDFKTDDWLSIDEVWPK